MLKKLGVILSVFILISGCTSKQVDKKFSGSTLNLFTWDGMFPQEVLDSFEEETGAKINYSNFDYDETMLSKLSEAKGGDYDVVIADDYIIEVAIKEGLVAKLDKNKITTFENINPLFQNQFFDLNNEYTVPYGAGIPQIVYNPEEINFDVTGYEDLWNELLVNNVGITANYRVINGITLKTLGYSFNTNNLEEINEAKDKLLKLAPNIRVIDDNNLQDYLISGEISIGFMYNSQVFQALQANPNFKAVYPKEGLGFGLMAAFIPVNAPNSDLGHAFLEYINRPEVAAKCFEYLGYFSTNKAADSLINDEFKPLIVFPEELEDLLKNAEIIENVSDEANELHTKVWEEFRQATN